MTWADFSLRFPGIIPLFARWCSCDLVAYETAADGFGVRCVTCLTPCELVTPLPVRDARPS